MRSPDFVRAIQIVRSFYGFLECSASAACVFRSCKDTIVIEHVQQSPCVLTGSVRPSEIVRCTCVPHTILSKIRPETPRKGRYDQLWLWLITVLGSNIIPEISFESAGIIMNVSNGSQQRFQYNSLLIKDHEHRFGIDMFKFIIINTYWSISHLDLSQGVLPVFNIHEDINV